MSLMERSFDPTVFTKNRQWLLEHRVGQQLFDEVVVSANERRLLCNEHLTVDGTLLETAAGLKGFKPRDADPPPDDGDRGNPWVDLHGARRGQPAPQGHGEGGQAGVPSPRPDGEPSGHLGRFPGH